MAFDGGFLYKLTEELKQAIDCHIDKIYQPSSSELVFLLRKKGFAKRLLICAGSTGARIHFTDEKYVNPDTPPMFCMLLRKHFSGGRIIDITQDSLERIITISVLATNEFGDRVQLKIVCEFIGNQSNIILLNGNSRIIDAIHRSDIEASTRLIHSGATYVLPQRLEKLDILKEEVFVITEKILSFPAVPLYRAILDNIYGISPLIAREIAYRLGGDILTEQTTCEALRDELLRIKEELLVTGKPYMLLSKDANPMDFSYTEIKQYGINTTCKQFESYSLMLDYFYSAKENNAILKRASNELLKTVNNALTRVRKRCALREAELEKSADREKFRIYGELIKANLYRIEAGSNCALVENYYDEQLSTIKIPLNPALSPANNAARYFKEYKKSYTAEQTLSKLIMQDKEEIVYLESVLDSITRVGNIGSIAEIKDELIGGGYIRSSRRQTAKKKNNILLDEYTCAQGYKIIVGKNNIQNDYITCHLAQKNDMWFHVKNIPGSHVVVFSGGEPLEDETILFAAGLAAANSKAAASSNVPVDYTPVKFVKKPAGAKPGMVIYTTNKTIFVTPEAKQ